MTEIAADLLVDFVFGQMKLLASLQNCYEATKHYN